MLRTEQSAYKIKDIIGRAWEHLKPCLSKKGFNKGKDVCVDGFEEIMLEAIRIDLEMNTQFAHYILRTAPPSWNHDGRLHGFPFDGLIMKLDPDITSDSREPRSRNDIVGLIVSPALLKLGNEYGEGFCSSPVVVEPATVIPRYPTHGARSSNISDAVSSQAKGPPKRNKFWNARSN